ncbi:MAG: hypothetical protein DMG30_23680 [Acidobacteria bacterium]|nr:MAG: hypothetical protein DMG30_23680 [Acidobacteriota bacterium]
MIMPRAIKGLVQFMFGLALVCLFMYPRMAPMIRTSRALKARTSTRPAGRPAGQGSTPSGAQRELIVSFASDVSLRKNATLDVREEFAVHSEGDYFRYGMIRDLPIDSEARWDRRLVGEWTKDTGIRVKILEVSEDGAPVSYEQGSDSGYEQLRIAPWEPLAPGDHRFVVRYEADGVPQFLADHDQLYWNALGHYWRLPVDEAVVRVHFPPEVPADVVTAEAYAGGRGASPGRFGGTQLEHSAIADGLEFRAANLGPAQSLSVSLSWPKAFLMPPALGPLTRDGVLLIAPVLLLLYYLIVWLALGREPQRGTIAIQYQPPQGLSPSAMRYIRTTGCDGRTLAATVAQLAARGCVSIEPQTGNQAGKYKVTRLSGVDPKNLQPPLAAEELSVYGALFEDDSSSVVLDPKNGGPLNRYLMRINIEVQKRLNNLYFTRNARWLALGTFASFLTAMGMALTAQGRNGDRFTLVFLTWWFFFCFFFLGLIAVMTLLPAIGRAMRGLGGAKEVAIGSLVVAAFGGGGVAVLWQLKSGASLAYALSLLALVVINIAAFPALKRLTPRGRQAREQIEGFRMFLEKVEQDRMRRVDAADEHAASSSEFVPYAIALEVREAWGDHLAEACVVVTTTR